MSDSLSVKTEVCPSLENLRYFSGIIRTQSAKLRQFLLAEAKSHYIYINCGNYTSLYAECCWLISTAVLNLTLLFNSAQNRMFLLVICEFFDKRVCQCDSITRMHLSGSSGENETGNHQRAP